MRPVIFYRYNCDLQSKTKIKREIRNWNIFLNYSDFWQKPDPSWLNRFQKRKQTNMISYGLCWTHKIMWLDCITMYFIMTFTYHLSFRNESKKRSKEAQMKNASNRMGKLNRIQLFKRIGLMPFNIELKSRAHAIPHNKKCTLIWARCGTQTVSIAPNNLSFRCTAISFVRALIWFAGILNAAFIAHVHL